MPETEEIQKAYYAVIPANIRYDTDIPANAKLLYGEITALCNQKGYCWATNDYFANLYDCSKKTVSRWIGNLKSKGYISVELIYKEGSKEIADRYIQICGYPMDKNADTPMDKKVEDNNTFSFNTTKNKKKERKTASYDEILSQVANDSLRDLYLEYIKMRKMIKAPMTDRALTMLINKVNELEPHSIERQMKLLETAIVNNWKSVYPLKDEPKEKYKSFNADEFFNAAVRRSTFEREVVKRTEEKTPPKTAAEDEGIRSRMEALKNKLME